MEHRTKAHSGVLATVIAVLAIAVLITFPYAFNLTWSLPGAESDRTLTYSTGKLTWDSAADIDATWRDPAFHVPLGLRRCFRRKRRQRHCPRHGKDHPGFAF